MRLSLSDRPLRPLNFGASHSIPTLKLNILNEDLLFDACVQYVYVFDNNNETIGEASIALNSIGFIGNVWIHPQFRKSLILFKMLQKLQKTTQEHGIKEYEAHIRDYTTITPSEYSGRLGIPLLTPYSVFYEHFLSPSLKLIKSTFIKKQLPSTRRSKIINIFYNDSTSITVEDYAYVYESLRADNTPASIGHVTQWDESNLDILRYASQHYDYLNVKSPMLLNENFHVEKVYKTRVFKSAHP